MLCVRLHGAARPRTPTRAAFSLRVRAALGGAVGAAATARCAPPLRFARGCRRAARATRSSWTSAARPRWSDAACCNAAAAPLAAARRVLAWRGVPLAARAAVYTTADADGDEWSRLRSCARCERRGSIQPPPPPDDASGSAMGGAPAAAPVTAGLGPADGGSIGDGVEAARRAYAAARALVAATACSAAAALAGAGYPATGWRAAHGVLR